MNVIFVGFSLTIVGKSLIKWFSGIWDFIFNLNNLPNKVPNSTFTGHFIIPKLVHSINLMCTLLVPLLRICVGFINQLGGVACDSFIEMPFIEMRWLDLI